MLPYLVVKKEQAVVAIRFQRRRTGNRNRRFNPAQAELNERDYLDLLAARP
jgi:hypothetical protein